MDEDVVDGMVVLDSGHGVVDDAEDVVTEAMVVLDSVLADSE